MLPGRVVCRRVSASQSSESFYRPTARPRRTSRRTSPPSACQRNNTGRTPDYGSQRRLAGGGITTHIFFLFLKETHWRFFCLVFNSLVFHPSLLQPRRSLFPRPSVYPHPRRRLFPRFLKKSELETQEKREIKSPHSPRLTVQKPHPARAFCSAPQCLFHMTGGKVHMAPVAGRGEHDSGGEGSGVRSRGYPGSCLVAALGAGRRAEPCRSARSPPSEEATDRTQSPPGKTSGRRRAAAHRRAGKRRARLGRGITVLRSSSTGWVLVICMLLAMSRDAAAALVALPSISDCAADEQAATVSCRCPAGRWLCALLMQCVHAL